MLQRIVAWAKENERHLGALVFVGGFFSDLLTFGLLDVSLVNLLFVAYLAGVALAITLFHWLSGKQGTSSLYRGALILLPLAAQFMIGSLLSGFLIYYTKSSVLAVSWPFLAILALVFLGNEWFRKYKDRIVFLATLFFFSLYAYAIFALPLYTHRIGPWVFLASTLITAIIFGAFLFLLEKVRSEGLSESRQHILGISAGILIAIILSYFTSLIPPIPLSMKEGGIYHDLSREGSEYVLMKENGRVWFDPRQDVIHVAPGETIYAYTAVFAPMRFGTVIVHRWEHYNTATHTWDLEGAVAFPMSGGRAEGYRGYSERGALSPGDWRVSVETKNGQIIGRLRFSVEEVAQTPPLFEVRR